MAKKTPTNNSESQFVSVMKKKDFRFSSQKKINVFFVENFSNPKINLSSEFE